MSDERCNSKDGGVACRTELLLIIVVVPLFRSESSVLGTLGFGFGGRDSCQVVVTRKNENVSPSFVF